MNTFLLVFFNEHHDLREVVSRELRTVLSFCDPDGVGALSRVPRLGTVHVFPAPFLCAAALKGHVWRHTENYDAAMVKTEQRN